MVAPGYRYLHPNGRISRRPPLPRRTRLRLAVTRRIDITCGWLVERGHDRAAVAVWRACRMW